jgi:hypothetical protein
VHALLISGGERANTAIQDGVVLLDIFPFMDLEKRWASRRTKYSIWNRLVVFGEEDLTHMHIDGKSALLVYFA